MQDSLEKLYQCFLWTAQFAQSCNLYAKIAEEDGDGDSEKLFLSLAKQYSKHSNNFLQMFQEAKDQCHISDEDEIAGEIGSFAGATDNMENRIRTLKNLKQFADELLPSCANDCSSEGLLDISTQIWALQSLVKLDMDSLA